MQVFRLSFDSTRPARHAQLPDTTWHCTSPMKSAHSLAPGQFWLPNCNRLLLQMSAVVVLYQHHKARTGAAEVVRYQLCINSVKKQNFVDGLPGWKNSVMKLPSEILCQVKEPFVTFSTSADLSFDCQAATPPGEELFPECLELVYNVTSVCKLLSA